MPKNFCFTLEDDRSMAAVNRAINTGLPVVTTAPTGAMHNGVVLSDRLMEDLWNLQSGHSQCNCTAAEDPKHLPWKDLTAVQQRDFETSVSVWLSFTLDDPDFSIERCITLSMFQGVRTSCDHPEEAIKLESPPAWLVAVMEQANAAPADSLTRLIHVLLNLLRPRTPAPAVMVDISDQTVVAQWDCAQSRLRIIVSPGEPARYCYEEEYVHDAGPVASRLHQLKVYAAALAPRYE